MTYSLGASKETRILKSTRPLYEINSRELPNYNYEDDTIARRHPLTEITTQTTRDVSSKNLTNRYEL